MFRVRVPLFYKTVRSKYHQILLIKKSVYSLNLSWSKNTAAVAPRVSNVEL